MGTPLGDHNRGGLRSLDTRPWECWISHSMVGLRVGRRAGLRVGPLLDSTKHHKRPPAPLYKSAWTRGLRQRGFACSRAISFGPADRHSYTATGCLVATTVGRHRYWGAHSISFGLTPTIRTHCFRQWGQHPELLGHQFWPRRPGRWHLAEGPALWTPTDWFIIG